MTIERKLPYRVFCIKKNKGHAKGHAQHFLENSFSTKMITGDSSSWWNFSNLSYSINSNLEVIMGEINSKNDCTYKKTRSYIRTHFYLGNKKSNRQHDSVFKYYSSLICFLREVLGAKENYRIILAPDNDIKNIQSNISNQLNNFRPHNQSFGFAKNKSAIDCVNYHLFYNQKPELLINLDVKNFFGSFNKKDMKKSLEAHGILSEDVIKILDLCTVKLSEQNICKLVSMVCCSFINFNSLHRVMIEHFRRDDLRNRYGNHYGSNLHYYGSNLHYISTNYNRIFNYSHANMSTASGRRQQHGSVSDDIKVLKHFVSNLIEIIIYDAIKTRIADKKELSELLKELLNIGDKINIGDSFLPQGSPASPAITNICFKLLDYKIDDMAKRDGAVYSRYADDLSFTWPKRFGKKFINLFIYKVSKLLENNGFKINKKKNKVIGTGGRMEILGYVINSGMATIPSSYFEKVRSEILDLREKVKLNKIKNHTQFNSICLKIKGKINFIATASPKKADKLSNILSVIEPPLSSSFRKIDITEYNEPNETNA